MATAPVFAATPKTGIAQLSTANTNRDGSGTIVSLFAPGTNGSRVTSLQITATATTSALQVVRLYRSIDSGTTWRLWREVVLQAVTVATGLPGAAATVSLMDAAGNAVSIAPTDRIGASAELAATLNVVTEYMDL